MDEISIFDIAGPIMVGPSSSHTAGACKIGQFARALFHGTPRKVTFYLHGSFGEVYKGHATDRALLGGVLKLRTSDPQIKNSFKVAEKKKMEYEFKKKFLGERYHPNTVKIVLENSRRKMSVIGSSVGGGVIEILKIDNFNIHLRGRAGKYLSLVVQHDKGKKVASILAAKVNALPGIGVHDVEQRTYKGKTLSIFHTKGRRIKLPEVIELEKSTDHVDFVRSLSKLEKQ
jgi:L-serine dehydratase